MIIELEVQKNGTFTFEGCTYCYSAFLAALRFTRKNSGPWDDIEECQAHVEGRCEGSCDQLTDQDLLLGK